MEIKIFAPVDCEVKPITECNDEMFSKKMMGDGICITPLKSSFNSFIEFGKVSLIFETKHAIFFEINDVKILMHIGMDTVTLKGEPFDVKVKTGDNLSLDKNIINVNLKKIKQKNLSTETPIVFDNENIEKISIKILKTSAAKQGDLIATANIMLKTQNKNNLQLTDIPVFENKYVTAAKQVLKYVGLKNFTNVFSCMTRLRFTVIDKSIIDEENIKKISIVKGINWNGNELQIIIGGEVVKVRENVENIIKNGSAESSSNSNSFNKALAKKLPFFKRVLGAIPAIIGPSIPYTLGIGMFAALFALLSIENWLLISSIEVDGNTIAISLDNFLDFPFISGLFYLLGQMGLRVIGVVFLINTVKFFNGSTVLGLLVALSMIGRAFFPAGVAPSGSEEWTAGQWINVPEFAVSGWFLFRIGNFPITVGGFEASVLPFIAAGIIIPYLDRWIKIWIHPNVDIVFRPTLVFIITILSVLFVFGPALSFVELGMKLAIDVFVQIPWGFGIAIFAALWQVLVIFGVHLAVIIPIVITIQANNFDPDLTLAVFILPAAGIGVWGQFGACLGVGLRTKDANLRRIALASLAPGVFGITEPIIYGVTLPRPKAFMVGCLAAAVGGFLASPALFGVYSARPGGMGITGILSFQPQLFTFALLTWATTVGLATVGVFLIDKERVNEYAYSKNTMNKVVKITKKIQGEETANDVAKRFESILNNLKAKKQDYKIYAKYMSTMSKFENKLLNIEAKEEKIRERLILKLNKLKLKILITQEKNKDINVLKEKYDKYISILNSLSFEDKKTIINTQQKDLELKNKTIINEMILYINKTYEDINKIFITIGKDINFEEIAKLSARVYNGLNSVGIAYGEIDPKNYSFSKEEKQKLKILYIR